MSNDHLPFSARHTDADELLAQLEKYPWFVERMMTDVWMFGLVLEGNLLVVIQSIEAFSVDPHGTPWIDVRLQKFDDANTFDLESRGFKVLTAPTERERASIRADRIVLGFELADT